MHQRQPVGWLSVQSAKSAKSAQVAMAMVLVLVLVIAAVLAVQAASFQPCVQQPLAVAQQPPQLLAGFEVLAEFGVATGFAVGTAQVAEIERALA